MTFQGEGLRVDRHRFRVEDLFDREFEEGDHLVVRSGITHIDGQLLLDGIRTQDLRDVLKQRIGLTFEGLTFALRAVHANPTEGIRFASSAFRALEEIEGLHCKVSSLRCHSQEDCYSGQ